MWKYLRYYANGWKWSALAVVIREKAILQWFSNDDNTYWWARQWDKNESKRIDKIQMEFQWP